MPSATAASGILDVLELRELGVHVAHERVEMHARLAADLHLAEERVHHQALAATDAAPQVDAARNVGRQEQALERRLASDLERFELVDQPVERAAAARCEGSGAPPFAARRRASNAPTRCPATASSSPTRPILLRSGDGFMRRCGSRRKASFSKV
jgi:hypothetical protein